MPTTDRSRGIRDAGWLGLLAFAAYTALGQETLYNRDAHVLLLRFNEGQVVHSHHLTYFAALRAVRALATPFGATPYESARLCSALGTALGVVFVSIASRKLLVARGTALLTTALVAACPAVAFFATVVEVHGPFFACAGLASWAAAAFARKACARSALGLGAALGLCSTAHATGHLMLAALLPIVVARARAAQLGLGARRHGAWLALALTVQAACIAGVPRLLHATGLAADSGAAADFLFGTLAALLARPHWLAELPALVARELTVEWIVPMLPLSVAFLVGLRVRQQRAECLWLLLGAVPYLALVVALLWPYLPYTEHGAYWLPLVWPAAVIAVAAGPRAWGLTLLVLSVVIATLQIVAHDEPERSAEAARGVRAIAGEQRPYLLLGDYRDFEALHVRMPDVAFLFLTEWVGIVPPDKQPELLASLDQLIAQRLAAGDVVLVTAGTAAALTDAGVLARAPQVRAVWEHLQQRWRLEAVASHGFAGWSVRPP